MSVYPSVCLSSLNLFPVINPHIQYICSLEIVEQSDQQTGSGSPDREALLLVEMIQSESSWREGGREGGRGREGRREGEKR